MAPNNKPKKPTMLQRQRQLRAQQQQVKRASANKLPPGKKGGDVAKPTPNPPAGAPKALPPGNRGGALATRPSASPAKPQPKPFAQRSGAIEKAGPTIDVKANTPKIGAGKPPVRTGQPGPNRAALPPGRPGAPVNGSGGAVRAGARAAGSALSRAGGAIGFLGTAAAAADQARRVFNPKDNLLTSLQQLGRDVSKATGDKTAPGGRPGYRQRSGTAPAKPRVSNIPPSEGTGRGGPSDVRRTQPKPPTRSNGGNPPAPGSTRRSSGGGGGSSAPSRASRPQTSSGTAGKGQQWADFNPNRGTSQTNNPLIKNDSWMMDKMKSREATQQAGDAQKLGNKFDTKSDLITPTTKVDGSNFDTKKIDQKKVDEYKRRKNRYYD